MNNEYYDRLVGQLRKYLTNYIILVNNSIDRLVGRRKHKLMAVLSRKKEKRALIIEAAAKVFARRGFSGTLMANIAVEAGIGDCEQSNAILELAGVPCEGPVDGRQEPRSGADRAHGERECVVPGLDPQHVAQGPLS